MMARASERPVGRRSRADRGRGRGRSRPELLELEPRTLLATITVTGTGDTIAADGAVTLREALTAANTNVGSGDAPAGDAGLDTIAFNIPGAGTLTITPLTPLPDIVQPVVIDGYSQSGTSPNTLAAGDNAVLRIELNGVNLMNGVSVLEIEGGGSTVRGLVINRNVGPVDRPGGGIALLSGGNRIAGNFIGTDAAGTTAAGNGLGVGVGGVSNTVGGTTPADRNVISASMFNGIGNPVGIRIEGPGVTGNLVAGNFIGTDRTGTADLGNGFDGIVVAAPGNTVGGTTAGARNVISGNQRFGVFVAAAGNLVAGNYIGTDATGTARLGNGFSGVFVNDLPGNTVGGTTPGARNVISANNEGVAILNPGATGNLVVGNFIGTDATGTAALGNGVGVAISSSGNTVGGTVTGARNVIAGNDREGVALVNNGGANPGGSNLVAGNSIGTDLTGTIDLGNGLSGVSIINSPGNTVGGTTDGARNLISGNDRHGVFIVSAGATGNLVAGNFIGTEVTGASALGNLVGVTIQNAPGNTVGGTTAGARNVISGNTSGSGIGFGFGFGVYLLGLGSTGNLVAGNYIGTDAAGTTALANSLGINIDNAPGNTVGGTTAGARNVISGNTSGSGIGVQLFGTGATGNLVAGNFIGTDAAGTAALANNQGIRIEAAPGNTVGGTTAGARNVISGNTSGFGIGVFITGAAATDNLVVGNSIGTAAAGTAALGNRTGILIEDAPGNTVGGTTAGARNVISGNTSGSGIGFGVYLLGLGSTGNLVAGNFIGTDAAGTAALANIQGIRIQAAPGNTVGGTTAGARNVISGNTSGLGIGVFITGAAATDNLVVGNSIGTAAAGTAALGNRTGILIEDAPGNTVGGTTAADRNVISGNGGPGVAIVGAAAVGDQILGNLIFGNAALGIDLGNNGVTPNDPGDGDGGPNLFQNFPQDLLATSDGPSTFVSGVVDSPGTFRVEFFLNAAADPTGFGEGQTFLGAITAIGGMPFTATLPGGIVGQFLTATATNTTTLDTSEFSAAAAINAPPAISIGDTMVSEAAGTATFTITLDVASAQMVTVLASTADGTATATGDYTAQTAVLITFLPGVTAQSFSVPIVNEALDEPDETFFVNLTGATNASIADAQATGTIVDDDPPPALTIGDVTVSEADGTATFTVSLAMPSGLTVQVDFATGDGTATAGADFMTATGTLTFTPGATTRTIIVPIVDNGAFEATETFTVTLSGPVNATLGDAVGVGTIADDEPTPTLVLGDAAVAEGDGGTAALAFTVTLSVLSEVPITVDFATADGTATAPADYQPTSGTVTFAPLSTSQMIVVPVVGDALDEPDETFTVTLSNPTGGAAVGDGTATGTIGDDDPPPAATIGDVTVDEGTGTATFTVTLSAPSGQPVSVTAATADGTAEAPGDYAATTAVLTFAPGIVTQTSSVPIANEALDEADETFFVNLTAPNNVTIADAQSTVTITDDDPPPAMTIGDATVSEADGTATFTVSLAMPSGQTVTVDFATADGTATAGADFMTVTGTLTFTPGTTTRTITVPIVDNGAFEATESFAVMLSGPVNATLGDAVGVGTIADDEPTPTLVIGDAAVAEGDGGAAALAFTVTLSVLSEVPITVDFATADGTATAPVDYQPTSGTVTFPPLSTAQTITVPVVGDAPDEPDETFTVTLSNPTGGAAVGDGMATGTIGDDDPPPTISIGDATVDESAGTATFTVTLSAPSGQAVSVTATTAGGTAGPGDFAATGAVLTFAPGVTTQTFAVPIVGDGLDEEDETFFVNLSDPVNATIAGAVASATIVDDDPPVRATIDDVTITEGDDGVVVAVFTVTLSAPSGLPVTLGFATADITATAGRDYVPTVGDLTFPPGVTALTIGVPVLGGGADEAPETFAVDLTSPANATLAIGRGIARIADNDPPPVVTVEEADVTEGNNAVFVVRLSAPSEQVVQVGFATGDGAGPPTGPGRPALGGIDYQPTSGTLVFLPGETVKTVAVPVLADQEDEPGETFVLTLSGPGNATLGTTRAQATILDVTGPRITDLQRLGFHARPTTIVLTLSEEFDPTRATVAGNYRLVGPGRDRRFGTADDRAIAISNVLYDAATRTITIRPARLLPLHGAEFQLTVDGTSATGLADLSGNPLDGDGDGQPGGDFVQVFNRTSGLRDLRRSLRDLRRSRAGLGAAPSPTTPAIAPTGDPELLRRLGIRRTRRNA